MEFNIGKFIKDFGLGITMVVFFLWQYIYIRNMNEEILNSYQKTLTDTVKVMITIDDKLKEIQKENEDINKELKELRYEQRVLNDVLGAKPKRYKSE